MEGSAAAKIVLKGQNLTSSSLLQILRHNTTGHYRGLRTKQFHLPKLEQQLDRVRQSAYHTSHLLHTGHGVAGTLQTKGMYCNKVMGCKIWVYSYVRERFGATVDGPARSRIVRFFTYFCTVVSVPLPLCVRVLSIY